MTEQNPILAAYARLPVEITRGEGVYLFDASGKRYLDFAAGIAVTSLGHCHPHLNHALKEQIDQLWHCSNLFTIPEQQRLAQRLVDRSFADKIFFCSSGLEAVETSIKIMRKYGADSGRYRIITLKNGFHGRSLATLSAGGNTIARQGFGPLLEGFDRVEAENIDAIDQALTPETIGILLEPIQAEGGVYPLSHDYLKALRRYADQHNLLLCFDEVQCGYGRTGHLFAYEGVGVLPDIVTCAKGIGGGFPLGACMTTDKVASCITPGTHGSTYGGNPLAMRVGNAVLDVMEEDGFFEQVQHLSKTFHAALSTIAKQFPEHILEIRGQGLLYGIALSCSAKKLLNACLEEGLITSRCGEDRVLRLVPPLTIDASHIDEATEKLLRAFTLI